MQKIIIFLSLVFVICGCAKDTEKKNVLPETPTGTVTGPTKNDTTAPTAPTTYGDGTGWKSGQIVVVWRGGSSYSDGALDFAGFNIYRSTDNTNWTKLNSNPIIKGEKYYLYSLYYYLWLDNTISTGTGYYYKIEALDYASTPNKSSYTTAKINTSAPSNPGSITGYITNYSGSGVNGAIVVAFSGSNETDAGGAAVTDVSGYYKIEGLSTSTSYVVYVYSKGSYGGYVSNFTLNANENKSGVNGTVY